MIEITRNKSIVKLLASDRSWIEGEALRQLHKTAELAGMKFAIGLPDLHPGRGNPVGAAFFSEKMIYPYIVGNDVGCGMGLWQTSLKTTKVKRDKWAKANRSLIANRFCQQLNSNCEVVLDACHNSVEKVEINSEAGWLHRKGAAPSNEGPIIIPGSRGSLSYLVVPAGNQRLNLWSLAHGAGRKWNRKSCKERLKSRTNSKALTHTKLGSVVICDDRELLFEEAPQAYKKIDTIIDDMLNEGLIHVIATLRPLITYKTRRTT